MQFDRKNIEDNKIKITECDYNNSYTYGFSPCDCMQLSSRYSVCCSNLNIDTIN